MSFRKATTKKGTLSSGSRISRSQNGQSLVNYGNALASAHLLDSYPRFRGSLVHHDAFTPYDSSLEHEDLSHDKNDIIRDLFNALEEIMSSSRSTDISNYENTRPLFEHNVGNILDSLSQYVSPSEIEALRDFFQQNIYELLVDECHSRRYILTYYNIKRRILNPLNNGPFE